MADTSSSSPSSGSRERLQELRERLAQLREKYTETVPDPPDKLRADNPDRAASLFDSFKSLTGSADVSPSLPPSHPKQVFFQHAMYSLVILVLGIGLVSVNLFADKDVVDIQGHYTAEITTCQEETKGIATQLDDARNQLSTVSGQLADAEKKIQELQAGQQASLDQASALVSLQSQLGEKQAAIAQLQKDLGAKNAVDQASCGNDFRQVQRDANSLMEQAFSAAKGACIEAVVENNLNSTEEIQQAIDGSVNLNNYKFEVLS
ncbi:hypothetical protein HYU19_04520 [Candidatus Woesearchaeota archaeon]|nr:hypothetical protein [Candidatus Woesearchaeota archaeon]